MSKALRGPGVLRGEEYAPIDTLWDRVGRGASALRSIGVDRGDRVAILMRNDIPFCEASLAIASLGALAVPVNWHGTAEEVAYVVGDSGARVLVGHADLLADVGEAVPPGVRLVGVPTPADIASRFGVTPEKSAVPAGLLAWPTWIDEFPPLDEPVRDTPPSIIYTSGTTGRPKGVQRVPVADVPGEALESFAAEVSAIFGPTPGMRTVIMAPLHHSAPNGYMLMALRAEGLVVLMPKFDPEELLALIERHRITHLTMVPTMFVRLLKLDAEVRTRYDVSSLEHVSHGAAPCPPDVKRAMIDWWGPIVCEYYGASETGVVVGCTSQEWLAHPGTVGRPLTTAEVRVLDDAGNDVPVGAVGEIYMRAWANSDFTYIGAPEARAEVDRAGLVTCGDVGYLDEDGYLYLCDRKRDMVISGGVNIYPAEIEACLLMLPGVSDCAVFGIPDPDLGEAVAAAIERQAGATLTEGDVRDHVRAHLAGFKVPKLVVFHSSLPREDTGKIFKRKLRAPYWEAVGRAI